MWINRQAGFTLVEIVVATTITVVGMLAALQVAQATSRASVGNEQKVVATNLAREGIEMVRNTRDSNWQNYAHTAQRNKLTGGSASTGPWDSYCTTAGSANPRNCDGRFTTAATLIPHYPAAAEAVPYFTATDSNPLAAEKRICPVVKNGPYVNNPGPAPCLDKPYFRSITVTPSGKTGAAAGSCEATTASSTNASFRVTSTVVWQEGGGRQREVALEEYLTNWRRCSSNNAGP